MSDLVAVGLTLGVVVLAAVVGVLVTKVRRPVHPRVDLSTLEVGPGIVVFTMVGCRNCADALRVAAATGAPVREVTWELEPGAFEAAGVEMAPLVVVVGEGGAVVDVVAGVPPRRRLARALRRAGGREMLGRERRRA